MANCMSRHCTLLGEDRLDFLKRSNKRRVYDIPQVDTGRQCPNTEKEVAAVLGTFDAIFNTSCTTLTTCFQQSSRGLPGLLQSCIKLLTGRSMARRLSLVLAPLALCVW